MKKNKTNLLKIFSLIAYLAMITVNFLANALPIAGKNTGEVSDLYPNLFTPAGITFSIWGLIYLLLATYIIYYLVKKNKDNNIALFNKVAIFFIISSLANVAWIFVWHHGILILSVLLMLIILISLIKIVDLVNKEKLAKKEQFFLYLPFSIYLGWISVATIANITALLVGLNWGAWGISEVTWMIIILFIGAIIGILRSIKNKNIPYLLVFIWAYFGIWLKHSSESGFNGEYPLVIRSVLIALALLFMSLVFVLYKKNKKLSTKEKI